MWQRINYLNKSEKQTFAYHISYFLIEGLIKGILILNEFVLIKSLMGSDYQVGFMFQFTVVVLIFSVFCNEVLKRIFNKKRFLRIIAIITRLPLFLLIFFPDSAEKTAENPVYSYLFLGLFLVYYMANPFIFPTINLFLKANYRHSNFGKLYSYSSTANKVIMLISTFLFGLLLDYDNYAFRYIYPMVAVMGMVSIFLLTRIDYKENPHAMPRKRLLTAMRESLVNMWHIIKTNKPYRDLEIGFMLYGFAWMSTSAVINIFFERALHLNYSSVAFYKNAYNILAIVLLPFFGKLIGNIDPRKFGVYTFLSLMMHLLFMQLTLYFPYHTEVFGLEIYITLILSYISYGFFAATMALLWHIGSAYFCKPEEAGTYQSVHLTLTGLRALYSPLLGVFFYELLGFSGAFFIGISALLISILLMYVSMRRH